MKHGKAALLLDLAMELQARIEGMTIDEIAAFIENKLPSFSQSRVPTESE